MAPDDPMLAQHRVWEDWAQADPLWAILSDPTRKGGRWDLDEFFASGKPDVQLAIDQVAERKIPLNQGRSLDFGCGVGRLTQALADHFERSDGVDIAETMIELANTYNRVGDRCRYHLNQQADLALFDDDSFDFVYSTIVLQHNPPDVAARYIEEFVRILAPGGVAVFDMTAELAGTSLPPASHQAAISLGPIGTVVPGEPFTVAVTVTNTSGQDWPAGTRLAAGNHWYPAGSDRMLVQDDGRATMHDGLTAGSTTDVALQVTAPDEAGRYRLEVDLVEEAVCWFADVGGQPASVDVKVARRRWNRRTDPAEAPPPPDSQGPAPFEMNGLPREQVEATVAATGADLVDVLHSDRGGANWDGYRYFVVKPQRP